MKKKKRAGKRKTAKKPRKVKKKAEKEPKQYFVEIEEPTAVRKDILISVKDLLDSLKRYENYVEIQDKKQEAVAKLKKKFSEILVLNRRLRSKLPKEAVSELVREEEETLPMPPIGARQSKLEQLEEELAEIESRLSSLE